MARLFLYIFFAGIFLLISGESEDLFLDNQSSKVLLSDLCSVDSDYDSNNIDMDFAVSHDFSLLACSYDGKLSPIYSMTTISIAVTSFRIRAPPSPSFT